MRQFASISILAGLLLFASFPAAQAQDRRFVGNKNSHKYHVAGCTWERRMNQSNRVYFQTPEEAEKAGYVPCKVCRPEQHKASKKR